VLLNLLGRYQSKIYFDQNQSPYTQQPGYTLWDSAISYHNASYGWKITFNVKNIFDTEYDTLRFDLIDFLGLVNSNKGEGRRALLEFSYDFGN
jgi:outer membrane receptor protein involved in Fe transport